MHRVGQSTGSHQATQQATGEKLLSRSRSYVASETTDRIPGTSHLSAVQCITAVVLLASQPEAHRHPAMAQESNAE